MRRIDLKIIVILFLWIFLLVNTMISMALTSIGVIRWSVVAILVLCILYGMKEKNVVNPYFLFLLAPISLLIYMPISYRIMAELTYETWLLATINMAAFVFGMLITPKFKSRSNCKGLGLSKKTQYITLFAFLILGVLPGYFNSFTGAILPLASLMEPLQMAALVCAVSMKDWRSTVLVLAVILFPVVFGDVTKSTVLTICVAGLILVDKALYNKPGYRKKMAVGVALVVALMISSFQFTNRYRGEYDSDETVEYFDKFAEMEWGGDSRLLMPYLYISSSWCNLQHVMQTQDTRTYGLWTIKPILGYLQIDDLFKPQYHLAAFSAFNTFTFVTVHFKDFGFWGSMLISLLLGVFVMKVFSRYSISRSPLDIVAYVFVAQATLEMFFSNHFFMLSYPFTIVIMMEAFKWVFCRNHKPELEMDDISSN